MSTSRLEKFIYAICSMEVSDLPAPLSRIEILWNCLITGETPDFEPQSRNEQYLMAMLGLYELENLPTPMSRGEKLLYKIAMGETDLSDIPAYLSRYEELLGYLAENGGVGNFEYILQTLNQRLSTLYSTKERPMKQAVIKGNTLVNELPRPSLKNTMANVESQKLNHGYDNSKTLVNLTDEKDYLVLNSSSYFYELNPKVNLEPNKKYLFSANVKAINAPNQGICLMLKDVNNSSKFVAKLSKNVGRFYYTITPVSEINIVNFYIHGDDRDNGGIIEIGEPLLVEYQDGMENWDIPYFEGTKTFSATPNVVDGEFKQMVVKGQTLLVDELGNECEIPNSLKVAMGAWIDTASGVETASSTSFNTRFLKCPTVPFIIKGNNKYKRIIFYNKEKQYIRGIYSGIANNSNFVINSIPSNAFYIRISASIAKDNNTLYTPDTKLLIEDKNGNNLYITQLQSVQLSEVTTTGKNLFDINDIPSSYRGSKATLTNNGSIVVTSISEVGACYVTLSSYIEIKLKKDKVYSLSYSYSTNNSDANITLVDNTGSALPSTIINNTNDKFIRSYTPSKDIDVSLRFYVSTSPDGKNGGVTTYTNIQIEESSTATPYEPYHSNTLTLAEPVNLRKVGDVEDEFDALTGQVTERVGEIFFNSSDGWLPNNVVFNNVYEFKYPLPRSCENFKAISNSFNQAPTGDFERFNTYGNYLYLCINKSKLSSNTLDSLDEYLKSNPLTVQYKLATKSTKTINSTITDQDGTTQTKLHSFNDGYLSVSSQGLLPSAVNYEVPTNNSYYLPDMLTLGAQYTSRGSADCNATIDGKLLALGKNKTFTTPSSLTNRLMVLDAVVDDLMFIKGDQTAKDFGYFEGMKSVVLSNKMPVLTTTGKNVVNPIEDLFVYRSGFTKPRVLFENGGFSFTSEFNASICGFRLPVKLLKDEMYYVKCDYENMTTIRLYGSNVLSDEIDTTWETIVINQNGGRFSFNKQFDYYYVAFYPNQNSRMKIKNLQIEQGSTATSYEPYKSNILSASEDVTLRGIGNVRDELDLLTGEVTERVGEIVLDGSDDELWTKKRNSTTDYIGFYILSKNVNPKPLNNSVIINDKFITINDHIWNDMNKEGIYIGGSAIAVSISKSKLSSEDENGFKEWLQLNPITLQYQLATESVKTVDLTTVDQDGQSTKLKTFNDITHVEIKADNLIPSVDVEVATKISETLSTLGLEHHDISNTQNELGQTIEEQTKNTDATMMATTEIYEQTL